MMAVLKKIPTSHLLGGTDGPSTLHSNNGRKPSVTSNTTTVESQGSIELKKDSLGMAWVKLADGTLDDITQYGRRKGDGSWSGWYPVAAETINKQNQVIWIHSSGSMSEWNVDSNWNWISQQIHATDSDGFLNAESSFNMDFNGDSVIGRNTTTVESQGSIELKKDSLGMAWVKLADGTLDDITQYGRRKGDGSWSGWYPVAAETINKQNQVIWIHSSGSMSEWNVDSNWNWISQQIHATDSDGFLNAESSFNMDFNGDSVIGRNTTTVESQGSIELKKDSLGMAWVKLADGTLDDITQYGRRKGDGSWPGWHPVAAETINKQNQVIWIHSSGSMSEWNVDSNWNWISQQIHATDSDGFLNAESSFNMDFNGDSVIGRNTTTVESQGSIELKKDSLGMAWVKLADGTLDDITQYGRRKGDGSWSGWHPVAAETINKQNQVIWIHSSGSMSEWNVDSNWNWISQQIHATDSDGFLNAESSFNMDFNGDSVIGRNTTTVESQGSIELKKDSLGMAWVKLADGTLDDITQYGRRKGDGSWSGWYPVAAETINKQNQVIWIHSSGSMSEWNVDSNWNWISQQIHATDSDGFLNAESSFNMDFNGDGIVGVNDDYDDNINTDGSVEINNQRDGELEIEGDHDWFSVQLEADKNYKFDLVGSSLPDPYLYLRDASGSLLTDDDDGGDGFNSQITFQPTADGRYFLDAGAYDDSYTGTYTLSATQLAPPDPGFNSTDGYGHVNAKRAFENLLDISLSEQPALGGNLWGLDNINAPEVWAGGSGFSGVTGENVTIAVIDTGVDSNHSEFRDRITAGYDFVDDDTTADDGHGHGTHVAGTIAGANDGTGITGVAYDAEIMPIRVLGDSGTGSLADVIAGIRWAADNGADVINLSLGGGGYSQAMFDAVQHASRSGAVVIMAAGNEGYSSPGYPAAHAISYGMAIGAVDQWGDMAGFSNRAGSETMDYVTAPGVSIYSAIPGGGYSRFSGTSMAAPHVAGIAGLLKSHDANLSASRIETLLTQSASNMQSNVNSTTGNNSSDEIVSNFNVNQKHLITLETLDNFSAKELRDPLIGNLSGNRKTRTTTFESIERKIDREHASYTDVDSFETLDASKNLFSSLDFNNSRKNDPRETLRELLASNQFDYFEFDQTLTAL